MHRAPAPAGWTLDPQLQRDTAPVGELPLCRVLLMNDANYPWLILVPRMLGAVEIADLEAGARAQLMAEIVQASRALKAISACDKINIAALGNVVSQLHVHVIARTRNDVAWPRPVWGAAPAHSYDDTARDALIATIFQRLACQPMPPAT